MLYLVRHTAVDVPKNICYGQSDVGLASSFEKEFQEVKQRLEGLTFSEYYTSPLSRCMRLAQSCVGSENLIQDKRLMEMNFGDWEMESWGAIHDSQEGKNWFKNYTTANCPNGESLAEMIVRVKEFYQEIEQKHKAGNNIIVFTHAGVIRSFMSFLENISPHETFNRDVAYGQVLEF